MMKRKLNRRSYISQNGITLIALVITIIVLLILAGVTISMVLGDNGIIGQAQSAKKAQENGQRKEEGAVSSAEGTISQYKMEKYDSNKDNTGIAMQNSTINGELASSNNPVIPKGFKAVKKDETNGTYYDVFEGFIIQDGEDNQFVWVPVENKDTFTVLTKGYINNGQNQTWVGREPDLVTGKTTTVEGKTIADIEGTTYDAIEVNRKAILEQGYENSNIGLKKQFEDEYNAMVASVKTYGGFYVGRYETSWNGNKVASIVSSDSCPVMTQATDLGKSWTDIYASTTDKNEATWYGLYAKQKELFRKNSSSSVVSSMIYGCQWDAIMNWMQKGTNIEKTFVKNSAGMGWYSNNKSNNLTNITGLDSVGVNNKVKNIYDLAGNYYEVTQEADITNIRVSRGGQSDLSGSSYPASCRLYIYPTNADSCEASRLQLYIK